MELNHYQTLRTKGHVKVTVLRFHAFSDQRYIDLLVQSGDFTCEQTSKASAGDTETLCCMDNVACEASWARNRRAWKSKDVLHQESWVCIPMVNLTMTTRQRPGHYSCLDFAERYSSCLCCFLGAEHMRIWPSYKFLFSVISSESILFTSLHHWLIFNRGGKALSFLQMGNNVLQTFYWTSQRTQLSAERWALNIKRLRFNS